MVDHKTFFGKEGLSFCRFPNIECNKSDELKIIFHERRNAWIKAMKRDFAEN